VRSQPSNASNRSGTDSGGDLSGRRRGGDRQPRRQANDPLLPRGCPGGPGNFRRAVIDGEIIVADTTRNTLNFEALQQRIGPAASRVRLLAEQTPASFVAFDLLALGDDDLTKRPFIERRNRELREILAQPAIANAFETQGMTPAHSTPEAFAQLMAADSRRWADLIKAQGITAE
jgi:hypothetical protein